jgi:hypothetical protein
VETGVVPLTRAVTWIEPAAPARLSSDLLADPVAPKGELKRAVFTVPPAAAK